jgi:hypothetical protein
VMHRPIAAALRPRRARTAQTRRLCRLWSPAWGSASGRIVAEGNGQASPASRPCCSRT